MSVSADLSAEESTRLNAGLEVEGKVHTRGTDKLPQGTRKQAASAVVAGLFNEQAMKTGDASFLEAAVEAGGRAGDVGAPAPVDEEGAERLGVEAGRPAVPLPLTMPTTPSSIMPAAFGEEIDEEPAAPAEADAGLDVDLNPDIPDELAALLGEEPSTLEDEEEDFDEREARAARESLEQEPFYPEGYEDEEKVALRKEVAKLRKKVEHVDRVEAKTALQKWTAEAEQFFPCASPFLDTIEATSRRDFLKKAQALHERNLPFVEQRLASRRAELAGGAEQERQAARGAAAAAWGQPVVPGAGAVGDRERQELVDRRIRVAAERGGLHGKLTQMVREGVFRL